MIRGDIVIQQDDVGDCFFILEEGMVAITVSKPLCLMGIL